MKKIINLNILMPILLQLFLSFSRSGKRENSQRKKNSQRKNLQKFCKSAIFMALWWISHRKESRSGKRKEHRKILIVQWSFRRRSRRFYRQIRGQLNDTLILKCCLGLPDRGESARNGETRRMILKNDLIQWKKKDKCELATLFSGNFPMTNFDFL